MPSYYTLKNRGEAEYIVKKSRFIGYAAPVCADGEAVSFIEDIRKKHRDATHNVYAYSLREGQLRRYSDDGEPQGTAGVPVLNVLTSSELLDCIIVVTRYFGGTLLGTGGLVRAYSHTASLAVESAGIGLMRPWTLLSVECDYGFYGKISSLIPANEGQITDTGFTESVTVQFRIPSENEMSFSAALTEESAGTVFAKKTGEEYDF